MCLAVPGRIKEMFNEKNGLVNFMGIDKKVAFDLIEKPTVGEYVIVHAGFAIHKLDKEDALETIGYFKQLFEHSR
ncbi:MAG: HypC/HybG/HupF family hydrogenase formation chaperone [Candidatus Omnitrophica bacterium]|nr:HypC/HybG/HupF family hydrogenase formation chaperone [Candidatus Omnitrophota bacterium]